MIVGISDLHSIRAKYADAKIVLGSGCFDILHQGHVEFITHAKSLGDILIISVLSDKKVRERKGPNRPIRDELARTTVVAAIQGVDYALVEPYSEGNTRGSLIEIVKVLRPNVFVHHNDKSWEAFREDLKQLGTELYNMQVPKIHSTTSIIAVIESRGTDQSHRILTKGED